MAVFLRVRVFSQAPLQSRMCEWVRAQRLRHLLCTRSRRKHSLRHQSTYPVVKGGTYGISSGACFQSEQIVNKWQLCTDYLLRPGSSAMGDAEEV